MAGNVLASCKTLLHPKACPKKELLSCQQLADSGLHRSRPLSQLWTTRKAIPAPELRIRAAGTSAAATLLVSFSSIQPCHPPFFAPKILQHPTPGVSVLLGSPVKDRQFSKYKVIYFTCSEKVKGPTGTRSTRSSLKVKTIFEKIFLIQFKNYKFLIISSDHFLNTKPMQSTGTGVKWCPGVSQFHKQGR